MLDWTIGLRWQVIFLSSASVVIGLFCDYAVSLYQGVSIPIPEVLDTSAHLCARSPLAVSSFMASSLHRDDDVVAEV